MVCEKKKGCLGKYPATVVPELTGLQFLIVSLLFDGEKTSNELRAELQRRGYTSSKPAFSCMMRRMIESAIVTCSFGAKVKGDVAEPGGFGLQNIYRVSDLGVLLWHAAQEFYLSFDPPPDDLDAVEVAATKYVEYGAKERKKMADDQFTKEFMGVFDGVIDRLA